MDKRNLNGITWGFVITTVLLVALMLMNTMHRSGDIVLPDTNTLPDQSSDEVASKDALAVVEITPETVQAAIATLARPEAYRRTITLEQFWDGGSGSYEVTVTTSGAWSRTDRAMPDGRIRHSIVGSERAYVWYNNEREIFTAAAGAVTADNEQNIPTYEDILRLPKTSISVADYRAISGVDCIYVEAEDEGYKLRYWVSVETGLLVVAERLKDGEAVYRMASLTADLTEPAAAEFTLPDGTVLTE